MQSRITRRTLLAKTALATARSGRGALCARRSCRRQTFDRLLGSLGPRRQQRIENALRGMGREEQGRDFDRLHYLAGQQEPADHRRRGAGALGPRHLRLPELAAVRSRRSACAGRRHHGRTDQGQRQGQSDGRVSRSQQRPLGRGAGLRRQPDQGPVLAHRPDEAARRHRCAGDVSGRRAAEGGRLDARRHAQGRRGLPQGRPSVRHRPGRHRGQCRHGGRDLPVVRRRSGRRQGQHHGQDRRRAPGARILQEARRSSCRRMRRPGTTPPTTSIWSPARAR